MLSVRFGLLAVGWLALPDDRQAQALALLPWTLTADQIAGLLVVLGLIGRMIAQPSVGNHEPRAD
jgi:hypothetical protein